MRRESWSASLREERDVFVSPVTFIWGTLVGFSFCISQVCVRARSRRE